MKNIKLIILLSAAIILNLVAQAQGLRDNAGLQERLTNAKLMEIQRELGLSAAKMKELTPIYKRYDAELNEVHFANQNRRLRAHSDSLSTEEADKIISAQLDNAVKISTIRKKYYQEFKTALTPQQVMRLYRSEAQIRRRVMQEFRKRFGNNFR